MTLGLWGNSYVLVKDGRATFNEEEFEKAMDAHRIMIDSEPRRKAWKMAQKIISDIGKLEKYLAENTMGRVQPHAIGQNNIYCPDYLIQFYGKERLKLEPRAIACVK